MSSVGDISGEEVTNKKAASAFRTIGEAADELGVPQHVLRFWEKRFGQLSPVKRRGRRYYRPEDLELLQQIKALLYQEGYTIKGVQKYLANEPNPDNENQSQQDLFGETVEVGEVRTKPAAKKAPAFPGNDINTIPKQMLKTVLNKLHIANERLKDAL